MEEEGPHALEVGKEEKEENQARSEEKSRRPLAVFMSWSRAHVLLVQCKWQGKPTAPRIDKIDAIGRFDATLYEVFAGTFDRKRSVEDFVS